LSPVDALAQLTELLKVRQEQDQATVVYFHDVEAGAERLESIQSSLSEIVLPLAVEEVASVGMDVWFAAIAYGVRAIAIDAPALEAGAGRALKSQCDTANAILAGLGLEPRIALMNGADPLEINEYAGLDYQFIPVATFKTFNDKRQTIRNAVDHFGLHSQPGAGLYLVSGLRDCLSRKRTARWCNTAPTEPHRKPVSTMRHVRESLSGECHHARATLPLRLGSRAQAECAE